MLDVYLDKEAYSDVVREAQEIVELALKGMLRQIGMEPPHWHDVGRFVREHRDRFGGVTESEIERLAEVSTALSKGARAGVLRRDRLHSHRRVHPEARAAGAG